MTSGGTETDVVTSKPALIVIDMLVDFFDRHSGLESQRPTLLRNINALARAFREAGRPVIWVRQEFAPDLSDAFMEMRKGGIKVTIAGTEGCRLLPELETQDADHFIVKKRYSAFFRTELDVLLARLGTGSLVVAGINTHACVRTTVIDAYQRDLDVVLASECIASHDADHHDLTLRYLKGKMAQLQSNSEIRRRVLADAA